MTSPLLEAIGIGKSFPGVTALADVTLSLRPGAVHALVGENGAGKSTLINILSGNISPDAGEVRVLGQAVSFATAHEAHARGVVTVHQELDLFPDLTVEENIGLEQELPTRGPGWLDLRELRRRARAALASMEASLEPDTLAARLTPARRQQVLLGAALAQGPRVLILDEPTSSLSAGESALLFDRIRRLRQDGSAVLYVSHRLEEIFALADEVTVLRDGRRVWHGPIAETSPAHLVRQMVGRGVAGPARAPRGPGPVLLECRGLGDGASFQDVSLEVRAGEVLGVYGLIGAGRSEWAQALVGLRPAVSGDILLEGRAVHPAGPGPMARRGLVYLPEDRLRQGICPTLSVRLNHALASLRRLAWGPFIARRVEARSAEEARRRLAIRMHSLEQPVSTLSGGGQQKVVVGRWLACQPRVLLLDEPTRGIDVGARAEIHRLVHELAGQGRAVVLISSDLPEVLAESDRIAVFRAGRLAALLDPAATSAEEVAAAAFPEAADRAPAAPRPPAGEAPAPARLHLPAPHEAGLALAVVLLFAFLLVWTRGGFFTAQTLRDLATDTALLGFCALGAMLVLLAGGIDISLGSIMALSAAVAGKLWEDGHSLALVVPVALAVGGLAGLGNAVLTLAGRVHPIVVTLATLSLYRGLAVRHLEGSDVLIPGTRRSPFLAEAAGLPLIVWLALLSALLLLVFLRRTVPGRQVYAVGSSPAAAWRVGISRARVWLLAFTLQGVLAGLAALLLLARSGQLQQTSHEDRTLEAIAAAVVGGVAITGGRGTVAGVLLGCLFLVSLGPACLQLDIPTIWRQTLVGAVMACAVTLDTLWRRRRA